jgi:CHAT domain-containing protein/Tfp pilus assembly protein PilF
MRAGLAGDCPAASTRPEGGIAVQAFATAASERGMPRCSPCGAHVAIVILTISITWPGLAADPPLEDKTPELLSRWERAQAALDAGNTVGAMQQYSVLLRDEESLLAASEEFALLQQAVCDDDGIRILGIDICGHHVGQSGPTQARRQAQATHQIATDLRRAGRLAEAVPVFAAAGRLALDAADTLAAILYVQAAALCASRAGQLAAASERIGLSETLTAAFAESGSWALGIGPVPCEADLARERLLAQSRLVRASLANAAGRYTTADSLYHALATDAADRGWTRLRCDALTGLGTTHSRRRRVEEARIHFGAAHALALELGDRQRQVSILLHLGYDQTQQRELDAAEQTLRKAMAMVDACGFGFQRGYVLTGLAAVAEARGERPEAEDLFRRAFTEHAAVGNEAGELGARQRLAYNLLVLGHYDEAITHYERCLAILDRQESLAIRNWVLGGLALTYHRLGRLALSAQYYLQSLEVNRLLGDHVSEAWSLHSLGILNTMNGDYRRGLINLEAARALSDSIGDVPGVGDAEAALGHTHLALGRLEQSREHFERALALADSARYEELLRRAMSGLALVCREAGRPDEAKRYYRRTVTVARKWNDRSAMIEALADLAEMHLETGKRDSAQMILVECNRYLDGDFPLLLGARVALLEARSATVPEAMADHATAALALSRESGLPEREWRALTCLSEAQLALGDSASAVGNLQKALDIVESLRHAAGSDELRRHMLRPALEPYEKLIAVHAGAGSRGERALKALAVSERSRAQILAARLRNAHFQATGSEARPAATIDHHAQGQLARITYLQARLQDGSISSAQRNQNRIEIAKREKDLFRLRLLLAEQDPGYADAVFPVVDDPERLLEALVPGELAISYFLGAKASYVFEVKRTGVAVRVLPSRQEIEEVVKRFLRLRASYLEQTPGHPSLSSLDRAGRRLHALLLEPVLADADSAATVVFIPDGILHHLPLTSLCDEQGSLLGRRAHFLAPSLRILGYLRMRERARQGATTPPSVPMIAVGAVGGGGPSGETARLHPYDNRSMAFLPNAETEARQVADMFPRAILLIARDATERSFKASPLASAAVLHLAAHGHADGREVRRSYLVLNPAPFVPSDSSSFDAIRWVEGIEDGLLQWDEVAALSLQASLVSLASCRSASGVLAVGDGVVGLTQAFLHAGASCVLATLGDVPDDSARRFMLAFYDRLRQGNSAAAALCGVQDAARGWIDRDARAAQEFVIIGDGSVRLPGPTRKRRGPIVAHNLGVVVSFVIVVAIVSRRRRAMAVSR